MNKLTPCLWFDGDAKEAVEFYVSLLPNSSIDQVFYSPVDTHSGPAGAILTIDFTLMGQAYMALNGGADSPFNNAISLQVHCETQDEIDRLWDAILGGGGKPLACGWIKDRWGLAWQIFPTRLLELTRDPDPARAKAAMQSMMTMIKIDLAALEKAVEAA